jgi:hypothetical protein
VWCLLMNDALINDALAAFIPGAECDLGPCITEQHWSMYDIV